MPGRGKEGVAEVYDIRPIPLDFLLEQLRKMLQSVDPLRGNLESTGEGEQVRGEEVHFSFNSVTFPHVVFEHAKGGIIVDEDYDGDAVLFDGCKLAGYCNETSISDNAKTRTVRSPQFCTY